MELKYISYEDSSLGFPLKLGHFIRIGNHNDYEKVPGLKVSTQWGHLACMQLLTTNQGRVKQRDKLWSMGTGGTILSGRGSIWIGPCGMDRFSLTLQGGGVRRLYWQRVIQMKTHGGRMEASSQRHSSVKSLSEWRFSLDPVSVCTNLQQVLNAKCYNKYSIRTFSLYTDFF